MRLRLLLIAMLAVAGPAAAENWQPIPGEADNYLDVDFMKVDQQTGMVIVRTAIGKPSGAGYAEWGDREPIMRTAVDCKADTYKDLGLDYDGDAALPDGWRTRPSESGIKFGVGGAGATACKMRDTLPKAALP